MILVGVGSGTDSAVSESVLAIKRSTNYIVQEVHGEISVSIDDVVLAIGMAGVDRVIFVSHGRSDALLSANRERDPYLSCRHAQLFAGRYLLAYACLSGAYLGRALVEFAELYIGFDSTISAPPCARGDYYERVVVLISSIVAFLNNVSFDNPDQGRDASRAFLDSLRKDAILVETLFDCPDGDGSYLDAEELICLQQFKNDICIWVRGVDGIVKALGAREQPCLWACQEFRVRAGIMGTKEISHGPTQTADDTRCPA